MKLAEAERYMIAGLRPIYDPAEAGNIARLALEDITGFGGARWLTARDLELSPSQTERLNAYIKRLTEHEPIQYILNRAWFYGLELYIDRNVLIPRPETEELVDWIIKDVSASGKDVFERRRMEADETTHLKILDIGTGSGCIALALKKAMPRAEVWGCDTSEEALNVARRNGSSLDIRVDFQGLNFLDVEQQKQLPTVDIIVSNPPYVPLKDRNEMNPNVVAHEPHLALFVPDDDPLLFYRAIAHFAKERLHAGGRIYLEIHENLGPQVVSLFSKEGYGPIELGKDMQGKDRMVRVVYS